MTIRTFRWSDYQRVIDLWRAADLTVGPSETRDGIAQRLARDPELFLVAETDGTIVGAVLGAFDGRRGWIYHLAVAPASQHAGTGSALLAELERRLRLKGCLKVNLLIEPSNAGVTAFYEHRGYRQDELIFMERWLDASDDLPT